MKINPKDWEEEWEDDESPSFEKLTHKAKVVRKNKQSIIQQRRKEKEKMREKEIG